MSRAREWLGAVAAILAMPFALLVMLTVMIALPVLKWRDSGRGDRR